MILAKFCTRGPRILLEWKGYKQARPMARFLVQPVGHWHFLWCDQEGLIWIYMDSAYLCCRSFYVETDFGEAHQSVTRGINSSHSSYGKFRYFPTSPRSGYPLCKGTSHHRGLIIIIPTAGEFGVSLFQLNESFDLLFHSFFFFPLMIYF